MFKHIPLFTKLLIAFLIIGIIPTAAIGITRLSKINSTLSDQAFKKLDNIRAVKTRQLEQFFTERRSSLSEMAEVLKTSKGEMLKELRTAPKDSNVQIEEYLFERYVQENSCYDLFLIDPDGYCFYAVAKEAEYRENLISGKYKNTSLGQIIKEVLRTGDFVFSDMRPYAPNDGEPAFFMAQPVMRDGEIEFIIAQQLSLDSINNIMGRREGLGKTGESYLVGPDNLMRSDSYLDPINRSIIASFLNPAEGNIDTDATRQALSGKSGNSIIFNYNSDSVLSAHGPVRIWDTTWALMVEMSESEVFAASKMIKWVTMALAVLGTTVIIGIGLFITQSITVLITRTISRLPGAQERVRSVANQDALFVSKEPAGWQAERIRPLESASLPMAEIAASTYGDTDNATLTDRVAQQEEKVDIGERDDSMEEFRQAMEAINTSSNSVSKIMKDIEDTTTEKNNASRVLDGDEMTAKMKDLLTNITASSKRVSDLISEMANIDKEPSGAAEDVIPASSSDKESAHKDISPGGGGASCAKELSSKAETLKKVVADLKGIMKNS